MTPLIPVCAPVVAWVNAALAGVASPDDAVDEILGAGAPSRVVVSTAPQLGEPGAADELAWAMVVGELRRRQVPSLRLLLPAPGDVSDLPGPPSATGLALAAGACAVSTDGEPLMLAPGADGEWLLTGVAAPRPVPESLGASTRALADATAEGAVILERLGLARGRDWAEVRLSQADSELGALVLPDGTAGRAIALIERGTRLAAALSTVGETGSAAVTAAEMAAWSQALAPLQRAARRAMEAGFSAVAGTD